MAITDDLPKAWRPPMGWNSWDSYGTTVTEREVLANARFIADHLKDAGWDTLVIDAGWFDPNAHAHGYSDGSSLCIDGYGRQIPDEQRFPSAAGGKGFGPLADAVHPATGRAREPAGQRHRAARAGRGRHRARLRVEP